MSAEGRLLLLGLHQVHVSLVVAHLRQSARDVGLLEHLGGDEGGTGEGSSDREPVRTGTLLTRITLVFVTSSSTQS